MNDSGPCPSFSRKTILAFLLLCQLSLFLSCSVADDKAFFTHIRKKYFTKKNPLPPAERVRNLWFETSPVLKSDAGKFLSEAQYFARRLTVYEIWSALEQELNNEYKPDENAINVVRKVLMLINDIYGSPADESEIKERKRIETRDTLPQRFEEIKSAAMFLP